jgi:hypothetical protein
LCAKRNPDAFWGVHLDWKLAGDCDDAGYIFKEVFTRRAFSEVFACGIRQGRQTLLKNEFHFTTQHCQSPRGKDTDLAFPLHLEHSTKAKELRPF